MAYALLSLHLLANVVWIGSILAVARVLTRSELGPRERGAMAHDLYRTFAAPAFGISFLAGLTQLVMNTKYYFVETHFMHAKLTAALIVIGLHHVIGARAKRMKAGKTDSAGPAMPLALGLLGLTAAVVYLAVAKPF